MGEALAASLRDGPLGQIDLVQAGLEAHLDNLRGAVRAETAVDDLSEITDADLAEKEAASAVA